MQLAAEGTTERSLAVEGWRSALLLAPTLASAWTLIPVLIVGTPCFGTLFHPGHDQGLGFGLANLARAAGQAAGQAVAASGSRVPAQPGPLLSARSRSAPTRCSGTAVRAWCDPGHRRRLTA